MRALVFAVAAVVALAVPASATAGWQISRAEAIGSIVWNRPCDVIDFGYQPDPAAEGEWFAWGDGCRTRFNPDYEHWSWPVFCTTMIHEIGHMAGRSHSENPASIMYPNRSYAFVTGPDGRTDVIGADRRCRDNGRPYLEKHGLLRPHHSRLLAPMAARRPYASGTTK